MRKCTQCPFEGEDSKFITQKGVRKNLCRVCHNRKVRECQARLSKEQRNDTLLKKRYGISLEDYNRLFEEQKGCCAVCGTHQKDMERKLFVDHCHSTGEVRGLLCFHCNTCLGHAKDSVGLLSKMITYLSK